MEKLNNIFSGEVFKVLIATLAAFVTIVSGYIAFGGPIPATRSWVLIQNDQLKSRLIDNSIQTNKLKLDLLHKEQFDRQLQLQKETNVQIRSIYQNRLNNIVDDIGETNQRNTELDKEKRYIMNDK